MTLLSSSVTWMRRQLEVTPVQLWVLAAILALAAVVRTAWVLYAAREPQELHDPLFYMIYADQIASGEGYRLLDGSPTAYYPVGYSATLGALFFVIKHTFIPDNFPNAVGFFQVFLGIATLGLAFYVGRKLFGVAAGLAAALVMALFPNLVYHTAAPLTETLFNFLTMATFALLVSPLWMKGEIGRGRLIVAGVMLGASSLVRPIALLWLPILFVVWLYAGARFRDAAVQTGVIAVATFAVIMPWTIRNVIVMDAPLLISANLGDDLCIGHNPGATGHFELPPECFEGYGQYQRPELETKRNNDLIRESISFAVRHPLYEIKLLAWKARWTYDHDHDGLWAVESYGDDMFINDTLRRWLSHTADIYFFTVLSAGGLALIALAFRGGDPRHLFLVLATLAFATVPLAFFGDARFHVPAVPYLTLGVGWGAVAFLRAVMPRLRRQE
jgi:4-amino-4-deoxy-L-arabinose transferase-like glycosyltransferase